MNSKEQKLQAFSRLLDIMDDLREQCPWDKKQTMQSLRVLTIEEMYELTDAILENDLHEIKKELGDVLLHLVFYSKIASEQKAFDIADVLNTICEKLIERHPHIYANVVVQNEEDVKKNWEKIKLNSGNKSILGGVPKSLPAMVKACRIQEKTASIGFDWENPQEVFDKIQEELNELQHEVQNHNMTLVENELGDVLFSIINYARFLKINPENALEKTNKKFIKRFEFIEKKASEQHLSVTELSLSQMNLYWDMAKKEVE